MSCGDAGRGARSLCGSILALLLLGPPVAGGSAAADPAKLRPETVTAFDRYIQLTDARNDNELNRGTGLLWVDSLPAAERAKRYDELKRGTVIMQKLDTRENGAPVRAPGGMIHHWLGLIFIPEANVTDVLNVLEDYNHHAEYYAPQVEQSRILERNGNHFKVFMRFRQHKFITVVLDTEQDIRYFNDSPKLAHTRSTATRIAQVENPEKPNELERTPGDDDGFLWRIETWWRILETDGGVYVQSEVVSLTRDIPTGLGWLLQPLVGSVPRETLDFTLEQTRKIVEQQRLRK